MSRRRPSRPIVNLRDSDLRTFWSRVAMPNENGCMLWMKGKNGHGYGLFKIDGFDYRANRLSLWLSVGSPPTPHHESAHSCRNRHCVAPAHLRWATAAENQADRVADGTVAEAERNGSARLTWETVRAIRARYAEGAPQRQLASEFSVSQTQIGKITRGEHWVEPARQEVAS